MLLLVQYVIEYSMLELGFFFEFCNMKSNLAKISKKIKKTTQIDSRKIHASKKKFSIFLSRKWKKNFPKNKIK
jgi:hypothetical protein